MPNQKPRGFAAMDPARQREIARQGGRAAHASGHAHEWNSEEAAAAGHKGGIAAHQPRGDKAQRPETNVEKAPRPEEKEEAATAEEQKPVQLPEPAEASAAVEGEEEERIDDDNESRLRRPANRPQHQSTH
jgi:general stress protein YciG